MADISARMHGKSLQSCSILCDPMDCSPPGSSIHGILQARILEWVAMPSPRVTNTWTALTMWPGQESFNPHSDPTRHCLLLFSCSGLIDSSENPWAVAHQAPLSVEFPRQEYWSGLPFPSSRDLPHPRIELVSPALAGRFLTTEPPGKPPKISTSGSKSRCWEGHTPSFRSSSRE